MSPCYKECSHWFTCLLVQGSREFPNFSVNKVLRSRNSGRSANLAAAYINEGTASLHSSGQSLFKRIKRCHDKTHVNA